MPHLGKHLMHLLVLLLHNKTLKLQEVINRIHSCRTSISLRLITGRSQTLHHLQQMLVVAQFKQDQIKPLELEEVNMNITLMEAQVNPIKLNKRTWSSNNKQQNKITKEWHKDQQFYPRERLTPSLLVTNLKSDSKNTKLSNKTNSQIRSSNNHICWFSKLMPTLVNSLSLKKRKEHIHNAVVVKIKSQDHAKVLKGLFFNKKESKWVQIISVGMLLPDRLT